MAASFSLLRFSHPRRLLLPLLMLSLQLYSVLSDAPPPQHNCSRDFEIRLPLNYADAPPGCGMNVISCSQGITWISLFSLSFRVRNISYSEHKIDIEYNHTSFIQEHLCKRNPREFESERKKIEQRGFRFSTSPFVVFKCDHRPREYLGTPKEFPCGDDSASSFIYPSDVGYPPAFLDCSRYVIPAPNIPSDKHPHIPNETFSFQWDFDCDAGGSNLPVCHCEDGSIKPNYYGGERHKDFPLAIILGCLAAVVGSLLVACLLFFITRSHWVSSSRNQAPAKVEKFLIDNEIRTTTKYTYNDIKKMTHKFEHKLGQGGYGSVYKGQLSNGIPVAVKLIEKSYNDGEEFCNEVGTIGRIHHVNVVRLLGFCVEGSRKALVYEFMANGSLEKFTNSTTIAGKYCLSRERLYDIALGIARGMDYLHQGCDRRIIHFDIKPHNILLDPDFRPKISDFGLAKSYCQDRSNVTITEGKGTIGYIAPELCYGNVRHASHKSDVYSYGMLLLSMVGMKEKIGPADGSSSEAYFPQWIHDALSKNQKFEGIEEGQDEIIRKIVTVALWCIQWNPIDRPGMKEVIMMLEGSTSNLTMPPNHFCPLTQPEYMVQSVDSASTSECTTGSRV